MKFPPGTGLRGQPTAAAAHADARPRRTVRARDLGAGGTRPAQVGHAVTGAGGPYAQAAA